MRPEDACLISSGGCAGMLRGFQANEVRVDIDQLEGHLPESMAQRNQVDLF